MPCYACSRITTEARHPKAGRTIPLKPALIHGWLCSPEPQTTCWVCGELAEYLCDYPAGEGTCDAAMCPAHAAVIGDDVHHCGAHYQTRAQGQEVER